MDMILTAVFEKVAEGYIGFVEELPGANTQGTTLEEARANLREAVEMVLDANRESRERARGHPRNSIDESRMKLRDLIRHLETHHCDLLRLG